MHDKRHYLLKSLRWTSSESWDTFISGIETVYTETLTTGMACLLMLMVVSQLT